MSYNKFKIENFCEEHNAEFKKYYDYLNNPIYLSVLTTCLSHMNNEIIQKKILKMITENHKIILDKLNKIDIIISYYKENNLINKSEIGKFFTFYENNKKGINVNKHKDLHKLFYKLITYEKCISVLKECFYIFSDYRACIYFMTPTIDFYNTKKSIINKVIVHFRDNINTLNQIITKVYLGDENPWGSIYYSSAYAMFESLFIIKKYFKFPLEILNITFIAKKICPKNKLIDNLCKRYHSTKFNTSEIDNMINVKHINNISQFIVNMKRLGYDMWYVIPLVFDTIYEQYEINGLQESNVLGNTKIYHQKMNNKLGLMCFILANESMITNTNIYNNFND